MAIIESHAEISLALPLGVQLTALQTHPDARGQLTEVFREEWDTGFSPVQWNVLSSRAGILRGVQVHPLHHDYFLLLSGRATIWVKDLRRSSPTWDTGAMVEVTGDRMEALDIPPGVAHGFYFRRRRRASSGWIGTGTRPTSFDAGGTILSWG